MYKAIIFDFFGVISTEVGVPWFREYFPREQADKFKQEYCNPSDKGEITYHEFLNNLGSLVKKSAEEVGKEWDQGVHINQQVVSLITNLKADGFKLGLLSDASKDLLRPILQKYKLEELFDSIVVSGEIGITKADKEIYQIILNNLKVKPKDALFIDDNPSNIKIAEELGMDGHLYKSPEELSSILTKTRPE